MSKISRSRIEILLGRILSAATVLFLIAGAGFLTSFLGFREVGWLIIMAAAAINLGLFVAFVALKVMASNAPD